MASMNESDGPVEVLGEKIPRLHIRDYLPWLAELKEERKKSATKIIPAGLPPIERFKLLRNIELDDVSPDDLQPLLYTAAGQIRVLEMAITKGKDKATADKLIDGMTAAQSKYFSFHLSGLYTADQLAQIFIPKPQDKTDKTGQQQAGGDPNAATFGGAGPLASPSEKSAAG